jgi:phosphoglycerol transferase MdoB-like AlkP superfamily enzyme
MTSKAPFGWTVVAKGGDPNKVVAYKRDCPADEAHHAADLAPFTFPTKKEAVTSGANGHYAYKR